MGQPPAEPLAPAAPPASPAAQPSAAQPASVRPSTPQPVQRTARQPGATAPAAAAASRQHRPRRLRRRSSRPRSSRQRCDRPPRHLVLPNALRRPPRRLRPGRATWSAADCGIGNDPVRKFCRRCGTSLAEAVVHVEKVPWWRRIIPKREKKPLAAGERPRSMAPGGAVGGARRSYRRVMGIVFQVLVIAAVVGMVVGYAVVPPWQGAVNDVIGSIRGIVAPSWSRSTRPARRADRPSRGTPPSAAFDGRTTPTGPDDLVDRDEACHLGGLQPGTPLIDKILVTSGAGNDFGTTRDHASSGSSCSQPTARRSRTKDARAGGHQGSPGVRPAGRDVATVRIDGPRRLHVDQEPRGRDHRDRVPGLK